LLVGRHSGARDSANPESSDEHKLSYVTGFRVRELALASQNDGRLLMRPITSAMIIAEARSWIGTPYRHQASLKGVGCDCLGLLRGVWRPLVGAEPEMAPPYAPDWAEASGAETLATAARRHLVEIAIADISPGDVVLFRWRTGLPAKHAAILTAPDRFVHAHDGASVAEIALVPWWRRRIAYAFRFPGVQFDRHSGARDSANPESRHEF
jgi:NlpC/P60 family putative phage cell wall peptidase